MSNSILNFIELQLGFSQCQTGMEEKMPKFHILKPKSNTLRKNLSQIDIIHQTK
mgnify:FL=1